MNVDLNNNILKGKFTTTLQVVAGYLQQYNNAIKNNEERTTSNKGVYERFEHTHTQLLTDLENLAKEYDFIDNLKTNMSIILEDKSLTDMQRINLIKKLNGQ